MSPRCRKCSRVTATRADVRRVGAFAACRVGFVQEAIDGQLLDEPVLVCLPCIRNSQPASRAA